MKRVDLTGHVFGKLTVLGRNRYLQNKHAFWECRCRCGNIAYAEHSNLRAGIVKSCGRECSERVYVKPTGGKRHGGAPLPAETVAAIRAMNAQRKLSYREIAVEFGVSKLTVLKIVNNQTHKQPEHAKGTPVERKARSYYL